MGFTADGRLMGQEQRLSPDGVDFASEVKLIGTEIRYKRYQQGIERREEIALYPASYRFSVVRAPGAYAYVYDRHVFEVTFHTSHGDINAQVEIPF